MGKVLSCPKTHLCWINTNQRRVRLEEDKESSRGGAQCVGGVTKNDSPVLQAESSYRQMRISLSRSLARSLALALFRSLALGMHRSVGIPAHFAFILDPSIHSRDMLPPESIKTGGSLARV